MLPGRLHGVIMIIPRPVMWHAYPDGAKVTLAADGFAVATDEASRPAAALLRAALVVGWDEVIDGDGPQDAVIMAWRKDGYMGRWAAELGHPVVMAPEYYVYLDWAHSDDKSEPLASRSATSVADVYTFDPVPRGLSEGARENIIGAQAQLWTEYIPDADQAEYMYFPRLCAFAEVVWSPPGGELAEFEQRLTRHLPRLDACHVNYRPLTPSDPPKTEQSPHPGLR